MSFAATFTAFETTDLNPEQKLVYLYLTHFHNAKTGQCNPSIAKLQAYTGLGQPQVTRAINALIAKGLIRREGRSFSFPFMKVEAENPPVQPDRNWWPSEATIATLTTSYPQHHFNMEDAVNGFIRFCAETGFTPTDKNLAFRRNLSAILDTRKPGSVNISGTGSREEGNSVLAFMRGGAANRA